MFITLFGVSNIAQEKKIICKVGIAKLEEFAEFSIVIGCVYLLAFLLFGIEVSFLET